MTNNRLYLPLISVVFVFLASACATTEDEKPAAPPPPQAAPATTPPPSASPAQRPSVSGVPTAPVAAAPVTPKAAKPAGESVYFDYDRYVIKPEYRGLLEQHAKYLRENPSVEGRIEGNADERGSREYNLALGQRRAEAVMRSLNLLGVPANRMEAVSYGEEKPRATGHDEESWAQNRRGDLAYPR